MLVEGIIIIAILAMAKNGGEDIIDRIQTPQNPSEKIRQENRKQEEEATSRLIHSFYRSDRGLF